MAGKTLSTFTMAGKSVLTILTFLLVASGLHAQQLGYYPDSNRAGRVRAAAPVVEQLFREYRERHHLPGLAYGVLVDSELVISGSIGYANLEEEIPASTKSSFRIASMSKSFTALAILRLRDQGKLRLDDPVANYLPEMKSLTLLTTDAPVITIRHLMTHSAGFPEDDPWGDRQLADSDRELRELIKHGISFSNVPGIRFEYSNLGFALLGQIVQVVSGMEFKVYMKEHVFDSLGMKNTVYEYTEVPREGLALGYGWIDSSWVNIPHEHHGAYGAMGGLITSIEDFASYVALHLSAWPPRNDQENGVLERSSLREMHHPWNLPSLEPAFPYPNGRKCASVSAYGFGLGWRKDCDGRVTVGHSGGLPGFGSDWRIMPDYGLAVMSFDNRTYGGTSMVNMIVLDTILALTKLWPRREVVSSILELRKNQIVELLPGWEGAEGSGTFAENFFIDNRLKDLVKKSKELFAKAGTVTNIGPMVAENQLRGSFTIKGEKGNIRVYFTLTPEKEARVQEVRMRIE